VRKELRWVRMKGHASTRENHCYPGSEGGPGRRQAGGGGGSGRAARQLRQRRRPQVVRSAPAFFS
jgi:hypothetical protein